LLDEDSNILSIQDANSALPCYFSYVLTFYALGTGRFWFANGHDTLDGLRPSILSRRRDVHRLSSRLSCPHIQ